MKNVFYSNLKALYIHILDLWSCRKNELIRKIRLISKLMTSKPGKQTIAIHIWPNISRSKDKLTMKFGQLIEYNTRNIFLEKSYTKCSRGTICRPFSKRSKLSISLKQKSYLSYSLFFIVCQVEGYQSTLKLSCRPLGFTWNKAFLKIEKKCGTSFPI